MERQATVRIDFKAGNVDQVVSELRHKLGQVQIGQGQQIGAGGLGAVAGTSLIPSLAANVGFSAVIGRVTASMSGMIDDTFKAVGKSVTQALPSVAKQAALGLLVTNAMSGFSSFLTPPPTAAMMQQVKNVASIGGGGGEDDHRSTWEPNMAAPWHASLPPHIQARMAARGIRTTVSEHIPREETGTMGTYRPREKEILLSETAAKEIGHKAYRQQVYAHEVGHSLDEDDPKFQSIYKKEHAALPKSISKGPDAYFLNTVREAFAELSVKHLTGGVGTAKNIHEQLPKSSERVAELLRKNSGDVAAEDQAKEVEAFAAAEGLDKLAFAAESVTWMFERIREPSSSFEDYRQKREEEAKDKPAPGKKDEKTVGGGGFGVGDVQGTVAAVVAAMGMGGAVGAASPDAMLTLTDSFKLLSAEIGMAFIPAVVRASGVLQDMAGFVGSVPLEGKVFMANIVATGATLGILALAANKASLSLTGVSMGAGKFAIAATGAYAAGSIVGGAMGQDQGQSGATGLGIAAGAWAGAKIGAAIGTAIAPGIGTAIGTVVGGLAGGAAGGYAGYKLGAPREGEVKTSSTFQSQVFQNPTQFYDKILMQAASGSALSQSIEQLQAEGNAYAREQAGYLRVIAQGTVAANPV